MTRSYQYKDLGAAPGVKSRMAIKTTGFLVKSFYTAPGPQRNGDVTMTLSFSSRLSFTATPKAKPVVKPAKHWGDWKDVKTAVLATDRRPGAAILLYIIMNRTTALVERNGHKWHVQPQDAWCKESGLSIRQFNTALAHLTTKGLAVIERHYDANGRTRTFIRATVEP